MKQQTLAMASGFERYGKKTRRTLFLEEMEQVADETTVCKFRHLLEQHGLGERMFERVGEHLQQKGLRLNAGTIVDATIINAPSSTKDARQERDPEMHQTRKGKQWCVSRT